MNSKYLDFEQPIAELQAKIDELRNVGSDNALNLDEEIQRLQAKMNQKIKGIFSDLSPWQVSQLSRHPLRPYTLDYVDKLFDEYHELHGLSDEDVASAMLFKRQQQTGSEFLPLHLQKKVWISQ